MVKGKFYIHSHHITSHFTNGLIPVGALLLTLYFLTGKPDFEISSFYCFSISLLASPLVFLSGYKDWKGRFKGRSTRIFNHKRIYGVLLMLTLLLIVVWRIADPSVAAPQQTGRYLYLLVVYISLGFTTYLGYLGSKFI
jgi:uncharacterized membrane protein